METKIIKSKKEYIGNFLVREYQKQMVQLLVFLVIEQELFLILVSQNIINSTI